MSGWIYKLTRWLLGGVFIYAGSTKLLEPETFAVLIEAYGVLPEILLMPVAVALPALEVTAGIGLFDIEGSLSVVAGLVGLFIAILTVSGWDWMWIADALARMILKPRHFMVSGCPSTVTWSCLRESLLYMAGVDTAPSSH